jgi:hypothetical protein
MGRMMDGAWSLLPASCEKVRMRGWPSPRKRGEGAMPRGERGDSA